MKKGASKSSNVAKLRRRATERMRSDKQYRALFDGAGDGILLADPENKKFYTANNALCRMLGYSLEEIAKLGIMDIHPEKDIPYVVEQFEAQARGDFTLARDIPVKRKDGSVFYAEINKTVVVIAGKKYMAGFFHDITLRKQAQEALLVKTMLMEAQAEASIDGILAVDNEGHSILFNKRFGEIWRIPREILDTKDDKKMLACVSKQLKDPAEFSRKVAYLYEHKDEKSHDEIEFADRRYLDRYSAPLISADGKHRGRIWYFHDITERKRAEEDILESKALFEAVVENVPLMIFLKEALDLRFVIFNRAGEDLLGYDRKALLGKNNLDLFPPEQAANFMAKDREVLDGAAGMLDIPEEPILTAKKGQRLLHTRKVCIRGADGATKYLLGISEDITERRQAEDEIRKLNASLEERVQERTTELARANQELETLIRIASHDLRSPLVNIQGFSQLLNKACNAILRILTNAGLPDETRQALVASHGKAVKSMLFINAGVEKMNSLISGLLRLSRLGRAPLVIQPLDMNALVQTVLEAMTFQIRKVAAKVTADALPDCRADAALINQVFSNLLDNAIKYRDPDRSLHVRVWGRREKDARMVYCVEDNGAGIAPEHQERIWDLFYRPNPQGSGAGEGIGLTAVQRIVERHGGKVWMESEPGKGSRFFLALPAGGKAKKS